MCFSLESWASHQSSAWCFQSFASRVTLILHNSVYFYNTSDLQILLTARCYLKMLAGWLQQHKNQWQDKSCHFSFNKGEKFRILHLPQLGKKTTHIHTFNLDCFWRCELLWRETWKICPQEDGAVGVCYLEKHPWRLSCLAQLKVWGDWGRLGCCSGSVRVLHVLPHWRPFLAAAPGFWASCWGSASHWLGSRKPMSLGKGLPHYLPLFWLFIAFYECLWILSSFLAGFHSLIEA